MSKALTKGADQISWKRALDAIDIRITVGGMARLKFRARPKRGQQISEFQVT